MRFFWIGVVLIVVFDSLQGSTTPTKKSVQTLNGTLQTHVNGTYIRKHSGDDSKVEKTSYKAIHEVVHHSPNTDWGDYTQKYSALINSFFNSLRALVSPEKNENEDFHFNVNTTFSAADENCPAGANCALPTITIEATDLKIPCKSDCGNFQIVQWGGSKGQKEVRLKVQGQDYNCYPKGTIPSLFKEPQVQPLSADSMVDVLKDPTTDRPIDEITDFPRTLGPSTSQSLPVPFPNQKSEVNGLPETSYFYTTVPPSTFLTDSTVNYQDQAVTNGDEAVSIIPPATPQHPAIAFLSQSPQSPIGATENSFLTTSAVDFQKPFQPNTIKGSNSINGPGITNWEQPVADSDYPSPNESSQYPEVITPFEVPLEYPSVTATSAPGQSSTFLGDESKISPEIPSSFTVAPKFSQIQNPIIRETTPSDISNAPITEPCESEEQPQAMTLEPQIDYITTADPTQPLVNPTDHVRPFPIGNLQPNFTTTFAPPGVFPNVYETLQSERKPVIQPTSLTPGTQIFNDVTLAPETGFTSAIKPSLPLVTNDELNYFPSPVPGTPITSTIPTDLNKNNEAFTPIPYFNESFTQNKQITTPLIVSSYIHPAGPQPKPENSIHVPDPIFGVSSMPSPFQEPSTKHLNSDKSFIPATPSPSHNNPSFVSTFPPSETHEMHPSTPGYIKPEQKSLSSEEECTAEIPNATPEKQPESDMTGYSSISPISLSGFNDHKLNAPTFPDNEGVTPAILPTFTQSPIPDQSVQTLPALIDPITEGSSVTKPHQTFNEKFFTSVPPNTGIVKDEQSNPALKPQETSKAKQSSAYFTPMPTTAPLGSSVVPESQSKNLVYPTDTITPSEFPFHPMTIPSPSLPPVTESQPHTKDLVTSNSLFGVEETSAPDQFQSTSSNAFNEAFLNATPKKYVKDSFETAETIPPTLLDSMPSNPETSFEVSINTNPTSTIASRPLVNDLPKAPFSATHSSLAPTPQNPGATNPTVLPSHQPFVTNPSFDSETPSSSTSEVAPGADSPGLIETTISPGLIESDWESDQNFRPETNPAELPSEIATQNSLNPYVTIPPKSSSIPFQKFLEMVHTTIAPHADISAPTTEYSQPIASPGDEPNNLPILEPVNNTPMPSQLNHPFSSSQTISASNLHPDSTADPAPLFEKDYPTFNTQIPTLSNPQKEGFGPAIQPGITTAPSAVSYSSNAPNTIQNNDLIQTITPQMIDEAIMTTLAPKPNHPNDPSYSAQPITTQEPIDNKFLPSQSPSKSPIPAVIAITNEFCDDGKPPETTIVALPNVLDPTTNQVIKASPSDSPTIASTTESSFPVTTSFFPILPPKPQSNNLVFDQQGNTFSPQPLLISRAPLSPSIGAPPSAPTSSSNVGQSDITQTTLPTSFMPQQLPALYEPNLAPLSEFEQTMIGTPAAEIHPPQMLPPSHTPTLPPTSPNDDEACDSSSPITTSAPNADGTHKDDNIISDPYSSAPPEDFNGMTPSSHLQGKPSLTVNDLFTEPSTTSVSKPTSLNSPLVTSTPQNLHSETSVNGVINQSPILSEFPSSILTKEPLPDTDTKFSPPEPFIEPTGIPSVTSTPFYWNQLSNENMQNEPGTTLSKDSSFTLNPTAFSEQKDVSTIAPPTINPLLSTQTTVTPELDSETVIPKKILTQKLPDGAILKIKEEIITTRYPQAHPEPMNQYATTVQPSHYEKVLSTLGPNEELLSYEEKIIATKNLGPDTVPQLTTQMPPMTQITAPSGMSLPEAFSTVSPQTTPGALGTSITPSTSQPRLPNYIDPNIGVSNPANILQPKPNTLVPDLTIPSISIGEEPNPLQCSFNTEYIRNMTAPSYYILVTKVQDTPEERFKVEKVFLGDGTPLNCPLTEKTLFPNARYRPIPFTNPKPLTFTP